MDTDGRGFPLGDLRVSDAERDRAVSELSEAFQAGRITFEEFDRRSTQALRARTGRELIATVADLPLDRGPVDDAAADNAALREDDAYLVPRLTFTASLTAICFASVTVSSVSHPGADWTGALTPAAVSVLCLILVILLRVRGRRTGRLPSGGPERDSLTSKASGSPHRQQEASPRRHGPAREQSSGSGEATPRSRSWVLVFNPGSLPQ
jgi:Domain of unknown function (DUF1707)